MPDYLFYQGEDESFPEVVREEIVATAEVKFSDCEYRNGNIFKQYCWAQTHSELDITLKIDESITARNLKVLIVNNRLEVHSKEDILLVGDFERKVKRDSLCWTVERSRKLCINIDKATDEWWSRLLKDEPQIDTNTIDNRKHTADLSPDAQNAIEKIHWEERNKLKL